MNKFITGKALVDTVDDIIWQAEQTLLIVSPFIKLDNHFKALFDKLEHKHELHIIIVFGKNESEVSRSFSKDDFEFFKKFPKISIVYVTNLHAKYYGNEKKGVITSINLYDASFKNNIEFGIYSEQTILNNLTDHFSHNPDKEAWDECFRIASSNDVVFIKRPVYEKGFLGLSKNYMTSEILLDDTEHFYSRKSLNYKKRKLTEFGDELESGSNYGARPQRDEIEFKKPEVKQNQYEAPKASYNKQWQNEPQHGYCIRTGEQILFNPSQPLSKPAWRTWNEYGNIDFPENYCHRTGKPSFGKTSMRNPILYNN